MLVATSVLVPELKVKLALLVIELAPLKYDTWPDVPEPVMPQPALQLPQLGATPTPPETRQLPVATSESLLRAELLDAYSRSPVV